MAEHHLNALSQALAQKGWKITSTRTLNEYPYDCHAWVIERGTARLEIHFDRFGGNGEDLPLLESYGCSIGGHDKISIAFSREWRWQSDLRDFIQQLDGVETSD